jgi:hypothetical protein
LKREPGLCPRRVAFFAGLLALSVAPSCGEDRDAPAADPGWLAPCDRDADCALGSCLCGHCSVTCDAQPGACSQGPARSACFARGSIAHEALCGESAAPTALCLTTCAGDDDCPGALRCALGACVPERAPLVDAGMDTCGAEPCPGDVQIGRDPRFNERALLPPDYDWTPEPLADGIAILGNDRVRIRTYADVCPPDDPCPTLEQALGDDACLEIDRACGLTRVAGAYEGVYWYTSYGTPPVAAMRKESGARSGDFASTRELGCTSTEITMCTTCGGGAARCEDVPGGIPPAPTPAPVPGCECESDGAGGARVSLECFCSLHDCPSFASLRADCPFDEAATASVTVQAADACGQIWFWTHEFSGLQLAYDPASGALIGASAFSPGPVSTPCGGYRVSAGIIAECAAPALCGCNGWSPRFSDVAAPRCEAQQWFQNL